MSRKPEWHKLPPVPGWYSVAMMHGKSGKVEGIGGSYFSEWKISDTPEQKNVMYYGPLPVWEVENGED